MIQRSAYLYHTLSNGLQVVYRKLPACAAAYMGVSVKSGSRNENPQQYGLAHFVEHTLFKGTQRRSAWHILNRMEAVGGELNAFTTKEETTVYTAFPAGQLRRATDLVADLITNSRFPEKELKSERQVVADEIDSYLDQPGEAVFDDFDDLIFADSSLGHNILGDISHLNSFTSDDCRRWLEQWYTADNMVAFYCGPSGADRVFETFEQYLCAVPVGGSNSEAPSLSITSRFSVDRPTDSHQTHTVLGARIGGIYSPERFTASLLSNILGGPGMNSLLNLELRERRGLVYTVEASTAMYTDCGLLTIYYGCDHDDNEKCCKIISDQIERLADGGLNSRHLEQAKRQYLGQLLLAGENRENSILSAARATLFHGRASERAEVIEHIRQISSDDIATLAGRLKNFSRLSFTKNSGVCV